MEHWILFTTTAVKSSIFFKNVVKTQLKVILKTGAVDFSWLHHQCSATNTGSWFTRWQLQNTSEQELLSPPTSQVSFKSMSVQTLKTCSEEFIGIYFVIFDIWILELRPKEWFMRSQWTWPFGFDISSSPSPRGRLCQVWRKPQRAFLRHHKILQEWEGWMTWKHNASSHRKKSTSIFTLEMFKL